MNSLGPCCPADEHRMSNAASKSDTVMENVELGMGVGRGGGGLPVERDAPTHWPFTSCLACSIFNVSQLTAAHAGSLVKNATHATTPAWRAHALVVLLSRTGLPNTPRAKGAGGRGVGGRRGVSVLHGEAGLLCRVPGAHEAPSRSRGLCRPRRLSCVQPCR